MFIARGLCYDLFREVVSKQEVVLGEVVLTELRRVLRERFRMTVDKIGRVENLLLANEIAPKPVRHLHVGLKDRDDEWVIASAVAAKADCLVTGDAELLALKRPPIRIVSPRQLWEILRAH